MSTATLDRLDREVTDRRTAAELEYLDLVAALVDGEQIPAGDVLLTCRGAGRTPERLRADVERLTERRRLAAVLTAPAGTEGASAAVDVERLERERKELLAANDRQLREARDRAAAASAQVSAAKAAKRQLIATAAADLVERHQLADERAGSAESRVDQLRRRARDLEKEAARPLPELLSALDRSLEPSRAERVRRERAEIERARAELERLRGELTGAEVEAACLRRAAGDALSALLVP